MFSHRLQYYSKVMLAISEPQWRLNRIPRSISRNGRDVRGGFSRQRISLNSSLPNRQGNACRMWRDMASGAAQFAELVRRVLPRNRSQLTRRMPKSAFFQAQVCAECHRVNNPLACPWCPKSKWYAHTS